MVSGKHGSNPPQEFICERCGSHFFRKWYPSQKKPRFCCITCRQTHNSQKREKKPISERKRWRICLSCGSIGDRKGDFCGKCIGRTRVWTEEMNIILTDNYPSSGAAVCAEILGLSHNQVLNRVSILGLTLSMETRKRLVHDITRKRMIEHNPMFRPEVRKKVAQYWIDHPEEQKEIHIRQIEKRIPIICRTCGIVFNVPPSRKHRKYCCLKCANEGKERRKKTSKKARKKTCKKCGKIYHPSPNNKGFCSVKCAMSSRKDTRLRKECETCGKVFYVRKGYTHARFCCMKCSAIGIATHGADNPNWRGGGSKSRGENWLEQACKARKRDGYTCQECGKYQFLPRLPVHHIIPFRYFDGDYKKANELSNLITYCQSCHGIVEAKIKSRNELGHFQIKD